MRFFFLRHSKRILIICIFALHLFTTHKYNKQIIFCYVHPQHNCQMIQNNAANSSETSMATQPGGSVTSRAASETRAVPGGSGSSHHDSAAVTGAKFRHGLLQLMIHTIDPMHDGNLSILPPFFITYVFIWAALTTDRFNAALKKVQ